MIKELTGNISEALNDLGLPNNLPELYDPITYTLENGGKRVRPLLLMLSSRIFEVADETSLPQALAVEIFHNFTLVHDDIMDNAALRRGRESVFKKWDQNTAILSGDVMYSIALQQVAKCPTDLLQDVLDVFLDMTIKVCEGQQMDMNFESRYSVHLDEYVEMIRLKTAYLLAGSLQIGALLGKAGDTNSRAMFDYGIKAGIAFQLMDDYLDAFGDPEKFGKIVGGDILAGKKTFLHIETLEKLSDSDRIEFQEALASPSMADDEKIEKVKGFYVKSGAANSIQDKAKELMASAEELIKDIEGNKEAKEQLINLTHQLINRDK